MKALLTLTALLLVPYIGIGAAEVMIETSVELKTYPAGSREPTERVSQSTEILSATVDTVSAPVITSRSGETGRVQIAQNFELDDQDDIPVGISVWVKPILEGEQVTFTGRFERTELLTNGRESEQESPVFEKLIIPFRGNVAVDEEVVIDAGTTYGDFGIRSKDDINEQSRILVIRFVKVQPDDTRNGENALEVERSE